MEAQAVGIDTLRDGLLKQTLSITIRLLVVLAFLLGMPLFAVPQVSERLTGIMRGELALPDLDHSRIDVYKGTADEIGAPELDTAVTMLASDRMPSPPMPPNPETLTATIQALKSEFVEAGASYMVLEKIGTTDVKYRFQFDVPVAVGSGYKKRFQVIDEAPDEAMRLALSELHQWRTAAHEPATLDRPQVFLR